MWAVTKHQTVHEDVDPQRGLLGRAYEGIRGSKFMRCPVWGSGGSVPSGVMSVEAVSHVCSS